MSILKSLFGKKESSCCNVKIEEVNEEVKVKPTDDSKRGCCK
jgi:hypothetical protein